MNAYDFDKTIYDGDSTADFYLFCLKKHKSIILLAPSLLCAFCRFYVFKKGTKTEFKEKMYRFLTKCNAEKDVAEFWEKNCGKIKDFYIKKKKSDDVIISASPEFLLAPICKSGINCHGKEKVRRFYKEFKNGEVDEFYSDSLSDTPMAEISKKAFLVNGNKITEWKPNNK